MSKNIGSCGQFARIIFLILNIFFVLVALALVGGGIYLVIVGRTYAFITGSEYASGAPLLIVCGVVTLVIAIIGIIAACGLWWPLMLIYSIVILLVVILELVAGILGFVFREQLGDYYATQFNSTIYDYRVSNASDFQSDVNEFVDNVQRNFECCGVFSPEDWLDTPYFTMEGFPESCDCSNGGCVVIESTSVYDRGCNESFFDFIQTNAAAIGGVGLSFGLLEIVGVVIGFILCCCIFKKRNSEDYWTK